MSEWIHDFIQQVIAFAGNHPSLVGVLIFIFSISEGLAIIGATLPGETVLFGIAAVGGAAGVNPWAMFLWAAFGAALGDGISFWMGRRYGESITGWRIFRSRPGLLERGEKYIEEHGAKSIAIARFIPVVRSIVPLAAGVLRMDVKRFYFANITSAIVWAVLHIFPAVAIGMAYKTLGEVSGRIAAMAVIVLIAAAALVWLVRLTILWIAPHVASAYVRAVAALARRDDRISRMLARLLDPGHPHFAALILWGAVLIAAIAGSTRILQLLLSNDPLLRADIAINHLVQGLRSDPVDSFMVVITALGDFTPVLAATLALIAVLLIQRAWRLALAAGGVIAAASLFVPLVKYLLHKPRPIDIFTGSSAYSFPSGHTTMTAVLSGLLAVLLSRGLGARSKTAIFSAAALWAAMVGASRIYLSAHWPSDVIGGLLFGIVLTAIFALLLTQFKPRPYSRTALAGAVLLTLAAVGGYHAATTYKTALMRYAPHVTMHEMALWAWLDGGWRTLPARRIDIGGESKEPLAIQLAGSPAALAPLLEKQGWRKERPFTWTDGLWLLSPNARLFNTPPLPILHNGRLPAMTFVHAAGGGNSATRARLVLRFWRSDRMLVRGAKKWPLYLGSVLMERFERPVSWIAYMKETPAPLPASLKNLKDPSGHIGTRLATPAGPLLVWRAR